MDDDGTARQQQMEALAGAMLKTPYLAGLGVSFERFEPDLAVLRLPFRADLTNDGARYHGGVIAAVLDTAGAGAAWAGHDLSRGTRASTVSMTVQYLGAAERSDLVATGRAVRRGRELIFTEISAMDAEGRPVAHAVQTYRIV